jgi:hypothetical protein
MEFFIAAIGLALVIIIKLVVTMILDRKDRRNLEKARLNAEKLLNNKSISLEPLSDVIADAEQRAVDDFIDDDTSLDLPEGYMWDISLVTGRVEISIYKDASLFDAKYLSASPPGNLEDRIEQTQREMRRPLIRKLTHERQVAEALAAVRERQGIEERPRDEFRESIKDIDERIKSIAEIPNASVEGNKKSSIQAKVMHKYCTDAKITAALEEMQNQDSIGKDVWQLLLDYDYFSADKNAISTGGGFEYGVYTLTSTHPDAPPISFSTISSEYKPKYVSSSKYNETLNYSHRDDCYLCESTFDYYN